ncbi:MAG: copper resistance protein CopC/CopD [Actinobacteria bacterium]|nr:copper resistance protein CopC/CopD [Actinomycetota bacterium]
MTAAPARTLPRRRRPVAVFACAALLLLLVPASASAHAVLETSTPSFGAVVQREPGHLTLAYDEDVVPSLAQVSVLTPRGRDLAGAPRVSGSTVTVPLRPGPKGSYTVRWRMVAADDGHVTEGAFSFGVDAQPVAPTPVGGVGIPLAPEVLAWLQFVGIVLVGGTLVFRALITVPAGRALGRSGGGEERIAIGLAAIGAVVALHAAFFAFLVGAYPVVGSGVGDFIDAEIIPIRLSTHSGQAFTYSSFAWIAALSLIVAAWAYPRRREQLLAAAGALSLAIAFGLSWAGHPAVGGTLVLIADYAHLLAAALWVGGLVALIALVASARSRPSPEREALFRACLLRFSALAPGLVLVLAAAGVYVAIGELPSVSALLTSHYGILLVAKVAAFAVAIALAAYHRFHVVPRVAAGASLAGVRRTLANEVLVLAAALALAAILSQTAPPLPT